MCPSNKMTPYYSENFDATTLWYDAIHSGHILRLVCPKLRNFENEIKELETQLDNLKDPYNNEGISEVNTNKISLFEEKVNKKLKKIYSQSAN